jgi:hypothetical protein
MDKKWNISELIQLFSTTSLEKVFVFYSNGFVMYKSDISKNNALQVFREVDVNDGILQCVPFGDETLMAIYTLG